MAVVARYHVEAMTLANILRTDTRLHRPLPHRERLGKSISGAVALPQAT